MKWQKKVLEKKKLKKKKIKLRILINENGKPLRLLPAEEIKRLNKELNSPSRIQKKHKEYLKKKKLQEKLKHAELQKKLEEEKTKQLTKKRPRKKHGK